MSPSDAKPKVKCTIVTGTLGSGKTSVLQGLISRRPAGERWAVVVNEIGALGLDEALLAGTTASAEGEARAPVHVRQLAGGCMCCTLSGLLSAAIAQTLRLVKPHRLLIEPSGLGHPGGLIDALRGEHLASALEISSIVCCIDLSAPSPWDPSQFESNDLLRDQVHCADYLVGTKIDAADQGTEARLREWAESLFPRKARVEACRSSEAPLSLLDPGPAPSNLSALDFRAPHSASDPPPEPSVSAIPPSELGGLEGTRHVADYTLGFTFGPSHVIPKGRVEAFARRALEAGVRRVKCVFRSSQRTWLSLNAVSNGSRETDGGLVSSPLRFEESAYRRDQRFELVADRRDFFSAVGAESESTSARTLIQELERLLMGDSPDL